MSVDPATAREVAAGAAPVAEAEVATAVEARVAAAPEAVAPVDLLPEQKVTFDKCSRMSRVLETPTLTLVR